MSEPAIAIPCSVDDCDRIAVVWLRFRGMGEQLHAHVCSGCESIDREYADVIESGPLSCPDHLLCEGPTGLTAVPPLLPDDGEDPT